MLSVLAIILGRSAKREIAERPGLGGEGMATAGIVLGWCGVAVVLVGIVLFLFVLGAASSSP